MLHVYEFEVFEDDGVLLAVPYDLDGGTQGRDMREVAEMACSSKWSIVPCETSPFPKRHSETPRATEERTWWLR